LDTSSIIFGQFSIDPAVAYGVALIGGRLGELIPRDSRFAWISTPSKN